MQSVALPQLTADTFRQRESSTPAEQRSPAPRLIVSKLATPLPLLSKREGGKKKNKMTGLVKLWYWNECWSPPTKSKRELKGPEGQGKEIWECFQKKKKKKILIKWTGTSREKSPFPPLRRLLTCLACCSSSRERLFSRLPPTSGRKLAEQEEAEWVPQQQGAARWLALPVQRGEETAGHVGLSYVLTCP